MTPAQHETPRTSDGMQVVIGDTVRRGGVFRGKLIDFSRYTTDITMSCDCASCELAIQLQAQTLAPIQQPRGNTNGAKWTFS